MDFMVPKFRRDPNQMVDSVYVGIAQGNRTVTTVTAPSRDGNRMESVRNYGEPIPRGKGGMIATLILGGMVTTLDEMEFLVEGLKEKTFTPRRTSGEIADMCRDLQERRNDAVRYLRKNPSERQAKRPKKVLHLPVGYRMTKTAEPGLSVLARV